VPQAVPIRPADTGVTKSDRSVQHLPGAGLRQGVACPGNKIDTMWGRVEPAREQRCSCRSRQRNRPAEILVFRRRRCCCVRRKGLFAVNRDKKLFSQQPDGVLKRPWHLLGQRRKILSAAVATGIQSLRVRPRMVHIRRSRDLAGDPGTREGTRARTSVTAMRLRTSRSIWTLMPAEPRFAVRFTHCAVRDLCDVERHHLPKLRSVLPAPTGIVAFGC
jgi:hypothetical protein